MQGVEKQNPRKGTETCRGPLALVLAFRFVEKQNPRKGTETLIRFSRGLCNKLKLKNKIPVRGRKLQTFKSFLSFTL